MNATEERPLDRWFARYSRDHRNAINQKIQCLAVPAILWSLLALLWCIPVFGTWMKSGVWSALAMFAAWMFYNRMSRRLGLGMLAIFISMSWLMRWVESVLGVEHLFWMAVAALILGWVAQFIGHRIEGRRSSLPTDLAYLLIGPAWNVAKFYRVMGWRY